MRGFVGQFNLTTLENELTRVQDVIKNLKEVSTERLQTAYDVLNRIDLGAVGAAGLPTSSDDIIQTMGAVKALYRHAEWHYVWENIYHQRIMLCERRMINILTGRLADIARKTLQQTVFKPTGEQDAFTRILMRIKTNLESRTDIRLNSSLYIPDMLEGVEYFERAHRRMYDEEDILILVPKIAVAVIRRWFGMDDDNVTEAKAHFIGTLMEQYGAGALVLPHVWETYIRMPSWLYDAEIVDPKRTRLKFSPIQQRTLRAIIANSKGADHTSEEFAKIHQLKIEYRNFLDQIHGALLAAQAETTLRKPRRKLIDADYDVEKEIEQGPTPIRLEASEARRKVVHLLQNAARVELGQGKGHNQLQGRIAGNTDLLQPLRERAISRSRINGRQGEHLTRTQVSTVPGLFSLFVFRNILFNTRYLQSEKINKKDRRVIFRNAKDFIEHTHAIAKAYKLKDRERFFCNQQALSQQCIKGRKTTTATQFWKLAKEIKLKNSTERPASFEDTRTTLEKAAEAEGIAGFGKLSRFLTLADMCVTGLVEKPSVEEMGQCIHRLGAGGISGLKLLGYLDKGQKHTQQEVVNAFREYYEGVSDELSAQEKKTMGWDTIVGEHTLCKVKRLWEDLVE